jgi:hypothetical protein
MFSSPPPFPVCPKFFSAFNVLVLAAFVATAKQYDQGCSGSAAIDTVSRPCVDAQFNDTLTDRSAVAKIPGLDLIESRYDSGLHPFIAEAIEPFVVRTLSLLLLVDDQVEHEMSVA